MKNHCSPEIFSYQPSNVHTDDSSLPSSILTQRKVYTSGLDGFYRSHISEAWLSLERCSTARCTKLSIHSQRLDV